MWQDWSVSGELGDPARRSDVNSWSGVAELALSLANWATQLGVGARALQLCNGRLGIGCFLMKNDAECYALCSHRPGCSVPLKGCFSKVQQLSTERGAAQSSV